MKLNIDDTQQEEYTNSMAKDSDVLVNCEKCKRLFYIDYKIGRKKIEAIPPVQILCTRCNKIQ